MTTKERWNIIDGPPREDLFDALRLRHRRFTVVFNISRRPRFPGESGTGTFPIKVRVNGISVEDGSGENWLLKLFDSKGNLGSLDLEGYFNTSRRKGWISRDPQQ